MKYEGMKDYHLAGDQTLTLPAFALDSFINTAEGWNLKRKCLVEGTPEVYMAARREYDERHGIQPCPEWEALYE